jgi:ectoine hydroxylase-related dioxygenase (phytanoyl-CoA dioxygenase family)
MSSSVKTEQPLSMDALAAFHRDGFVIVRGFFSQAEIEPLRTACLADPSIGGKLRAVADSDGHPQEVLLWTEASDTYLGQVAFLARMIDNAEALLKRPCYHWHSKLSMKRPGTLGKWDWHQDYPYWYEEGCLWPDMLTVTVAVDKNTESNGCMQLVKGSHLLGRVNHMRVGAAIGIDPERLKLILAQCETVPMEMESGDACFFHANTLHASGPNLSGLPRTLLHCSYNTVVNSPFVVEDQEHHRYKPFSKFADRVLRDGKWQEVFQGHLFSQDGCRPGGKDSYGYTAVASPLREAISPPG